MAVHGVFIGINKHLDPDIGELNGASRDAQALWSLFTDSMPELTGRLLSDSGATFNIVSNAIFQTLRNATAEDVVVITFSGHGSPDGRLVMYDTDKGNLTETAISMNDLSDAFRATNAKAVLCVLDCCFSGQAPARVIELQATPRNPFVYNGIQGEGRMLLTACAANEAAWEQRGTGHGILTYAIIRALSGDEGQTVSFPAVVDEIISYARVEASRIGVTQTPEFLGHIQGGLIFPALRRGENYYSAFPEIPERTYTGSFAELKEAGIAPEIIIKWSEKFTSGLNSLQLNAINNHGVLQGHSLMVIAPTSSGKTMVGELGAIQAVMKGKKAAFLLPYRALVNEKYEEFQSLYSSIGVRVIRCTGDTSDGISPALNGKYDIGFYTYETFLNLALTSPRLLSQLGVVIVDEGQFIIDPNRGIVVELILSMLIRGKALGIEPQLLVLSAVIGNLNHFDAWLGLPVLRTDMRPVPLVEGVMDRNGIFQFRDADGTTKQENLLEAREIVQRGKDKSSQDMIVPLTRKLINDGEQVIVFRNQRGTARGCARYLADDLGLPSADAIIENLPSHDLSASSIDLKYCLERGTAFHTTDLSRMEREAIERGFRDAEGRIRALGATTTLAAGINSPASTVILAEHHFFGAEPRPFTVAEYKNMAGRAGRLGYNEDGKAILLAENGIERARLFRQYVLGFPEDVSSSFKESQLATWILRLLTQVRGVAREEVPVLLVNTFAGYTAARANPEWAGRIQHNIDALLERMIAADLAIIEEGLLHLSQLGKACGASSLTFESSLRLVEMLQGLDLQAIPVTHLLALIQVLPEADEIYTPIQRRGTAESARIGDVAARFGRDMPTQLRRFSREAEDQWRRCKRAAIIWDWIEGESVETIEARYTISAWQGSIRYGDINRIVDGTRYHFGSAMKILAVLFPEHTVLMNGLEELMKRLEFGLPQEALPLTDVSLNLSRGQYLALFNHGCRNLDDIRNQQFEFLVSVVGLAEATAIIPIDANINVPIIERA